MTDGTSSPLVINAEDVALKRQLGEITVHIDKEMDEFGEPLSCSTPVVVNGFVVQSNPKKFLFFSTNSSWDASCQIFQMIFLFVLALGQLAAVIAVTYLVPDYFNFKIPLLVIFPFVSFILLLGLCTRSRAIAKFSFCFYSFMLLLSLVAVFYFLYAYFFHIQHLYDEIIIHKLEIQSQVFSGRASEIENAIKNEFPIAAAVSGGFVVFFILVLLGIRSTIENFGKSSYYIDNTPEVLLTPSHSTPMKTPLTSPETILTFPSVNV